MPTFLQLAPEQGGTRFGPFPAGVVQLGTDANHCQLTLAATPGIAPVHASITAMGGGRFTVQPTQQGLGLFLIQRGQTHSWPIEAPVTASHGDKLVIGSAAGPSFELQWEEAVVAAGPTAVAAPRGLPRPPGNSMASGVAGELQRQAMAKVLGRAGPLRDLYHLSYRLRSGSLSNPRILVSILGTVVVGFMTLATGCAGVAAKLMLGG